MSLERSTGAMSPPIGCWVKDEADNDTELGSRHWSGWEGPPKGRTIMCASNPGGDEEGLNWAEVMEPNEDGVD